MNAANLDIFNDEATGGPAYPTPEVRTHDTGDIVANADQGVTKLDWFAMQVEGRMSRAMAVTLMGEPVPEGDGTIASMVWWSRAEAKFRYLKAAAMLEARP